MKIADSLRQECMPEMVYSICRLAAEKSYQEDELKRLITLDCNDTIAYNRAYRFAIECGFLLKVPNNAVVTSFSNEQVASFKSFRFAVFMEVFQEESTLFTSLAKWYLSQDETIFRNKSDRQLTAAIPPDVFTGVNEDFIHGFRFWMSALGLVMSTKQHGILFAVNIILEQWLIIEEPFHCGKSIPVRDFCSTLLDRCPVFAECIDDNRIGTALSMGLRVLHRNGVIELKYTADSGDTWHLIPSINSPGTNRVTEIIMR